ncbi:uncharacterized protein EI90DRAFT_3131969 [Cantharellus anzutake]|uniref:uncharacterized protein n=1 Tax=Cantharellus anzutake TaxID=1750568 RepID=UPI00190409F4|nr:uncharacterized protein EI90DRAFT_3131969 [Cantharellus anzutake]KAF8320609.1 hypothetical protein EI90DRAFT_3131969 [Cantharellus anzutake]
MLISHANHVLDHYRGPPRRKSLVSLPGSFVPPNTYWTPDEKRNLYHHLQRFSRLRLDLVAEALGTKTLVEVITYVGILERGVHERLKPSGKKIRHPAAMEMSDGWVLFEEHMSNSILQREVITELDDIVIERRKACRDAGVDSRRVQVGIAVRDYSLGRLKRSRSNDDLDPSTSPNKRRVLEHEWIREDLFRELDKDRLKLFDTMLDEYFKSGTSSSQPAPDVDLSPYQIDFSRPTNSSDYMLEPEASDDEGDSNSDEDTSTEDEIIVPSDSDGSGTSRIPTFSLTDHISTIDSPSDDPPENVSASRADGDSLNTESHVDTDSQSSNSRSNVCSRPGSPISINAHGIPKRRARHTRRAVIKDLASRTNFNVKDLLHDNMDVFYFTRLGRLLRMYMLSLHPPDFQILARKNTLFRRRTEPTVFYSTLRRLRDHLRQFVCTILERAIVIAKHDRESRKVARARDDIRESHIRESLAMFMQKDKLLPRKQFVQTLPSRLQLSIDRDDPDLLAGTERFVKPLPETVLEGPRGLFQPCTDINSPNITVPVEYRRPNWSAEFDNRPYEREEDQYVATTWGFDGHYDNLENAMFSMHPRPGEEDRFRLEMINDRVYDRKDSDKDLEYEEELWSMFEADEWRGRKLPNLKSGDPI